MYPVFFIKENKSITTKTNTDTCQYYQDIILNLKRNNVTFKLLIYQ